MLFSLDRISKLLDESRFERKILFQFELKKNLIFPYILTKIQKIPIFTKRNKIISNIPADLVL